MQSETRNPIPVTVLTGFLGSGKTTLLNRILTENHGKRIAVIENEFGEIGIDNDLVVNAEEEIFEMNNGCICCTVRGDLIRILGNLMKRKNKFDSILIETTGLADPGPVVQTFFVDEEMRSQMALDGVITVVDAKFISMHLDDSNEAREQIAFADIVLINKIDLVDPEELNSLEERIHGMNSMAKMFRTKNAEVEMDRILNLGGFNLDRALDMNPEFLEPEYPFEWCGTYQLESGHYSLQCEEGPDPEMSIVLLPTSATPKGEINESLDQAVLLFSDTDTFVDSEGDLDPGNRKYTLNLSVSGKKTFNITIPESGMYVLFTQHHPEEFSMKLTKDSTQISVLHSQEFNPGHEHDDEVSSVGINLSGDLDLERLNKWLGTLLQEKGIDIFRMKGILSIENDPRRFVFQGVHMLMDARPDKEWNGMERKNQLIFIGRNLNREELTEGFRQCLV